MAKKVDQKDISVDCPQGVDSLERRELLQKIIDGQATVREERYFYDTIENCQKCRCRDWCEEHLEIKSILKEKFVNKPTPNGLLNEIKAKIKGLD